MIEHTLESSLSLLYPVPIIDSVDVAVLSLFEVEVNISLLTNGGQSVTQYIVSGWLCDTVSRFTCVLSRPSGREAYGACRKWTS